MNKSDLIKILSERRNLTEKKATEITDLIFNGFIDEFKKGGRIELRGFGSFVVREYGSYTGRNPKSGTNIIVERKRLPFFKAGKELKKSLNDSK